MSPGAAEIIVCVCSQNNLLLIYKRVSNSVMLPVLIWHQPGWFNTGS